MNDQKNTNCHKDLGEFEGEYKSKCPCNREYIIFSQKETYYCEYTQDVWVECKYCHGLAHFVISVN